MSERRGASAERPGVVERPTLPSDRAPVDAAVRSGVTDTCPLLGRSYRHMGKRETRPQQSDEHQDQPDRQIQDRSATLNTMHLRFRA